METIKAVLFDFDGVMTTDKTGTESICNYVSKNAGIDKYIFETEYGKYNCELQLGKITHKDIWDKLCININATIPIKILYDSFIHTAIDNEMYNLVKELKEKNYSTAIITDNKTDRVTMIEREFCLNKYFDTITNSAEIGATKDTDDIFLKTLETLNIKPAESIFIDNQEKNLIIPQKLGIKTICFDDKDRKIYELREKLIQFGIKI